MRKCYLEMNIFTKTVKVIFKNQSTYQHLDVKGDFKEQVCKQCKGPVYVGWKDNREVECFLILQKILSSVLNTHTAWLTTARNSSLRGASVLFLSLWALSCIYMYTHIHTHVHIHTFISLIHTHTQNKHNVQKAMVQFQL